ncbi:hypothetical protein CF327_g2971 [Tilletia walkeri]|uniref:DUF605-domain-containing protein n=1 Tax=Tilletia walkeri TaxID=117179 RepID=A0A8X7T7F4_9BASI|nr:hypothetical protein CF327_g2971 [Tilletia walkeri]KAE8270258.1 hypothetical protein A4X09_0g2091 [Tilletia walkeri]
MASSSTAAGPGAGLLPNTAELKLLTPFMQRAQELRSADPPMAYWCSLYAAQLGIGAKSTERESKLFLGRLMDDLEAQKKKLGATDVITDETVSSAYVENFALKVFTAADNQDRSGQATRATARNFLVASQFLEVLNVFGALDPEIAEKIKYAKWKAADIAKAFKEGRTPVAGPPGGEETEAEAIAVTTPGDTVVESPLFMPNAEITPTIPPPSVERTSSFSSSTGGGAGQPDASSRVRARLSIHAASSQSPNFSMPLPAPPKAAATLEAEVAAQQAELARLGLAPPDWRGSAFAALSSSPSSGLTGRPLPMPPQGAPGRDGLPLPPSGLPFPYNLPSTPGSTASLSANTSPHMGGGTSLPSTHPPSTPSFIAGADAPPPSAPLPPSSPSPYPYHHQPPTRQFTQNGPLPHPPPAAPVPAPAPAPTAPPLPFSAPVALAAPPSAPSAVPESLTSTQTAKAQKLAKWAISSLDYDDLPTAAKHLREALDIIEGRTK